MSKLTLTDFRNYSHLRMEMDSRPVVLTGSNGAGKTNILEALSFLIPGRGLRRAKLVDVARIKTGNDNLPSSALWAVAASVQNFNDITDIGTGCEKRTSFENISERRVVRIDGQQAKSQADLGNVLTAIWLTPDMDRLFQGGAAARMRFLDRLVYAFDPNHAKRTAAYTHAMKQRTRLLKENVGDKSWLSVLERTMAEQGIAVAAARKEIIARLIKVMSESEGPFPAANLALDGLVEKWLDDMPALKAEDKLRELLEKDRSIDAIKGSASSGVHKTDLKVWHIEKCMNAALCSTGEQKALLIAMILAQAKAQAAANGKAPILLLDEVAAHLDENRRKTLFEELCSLNAQSWLTGTDEGLFKELGNRAQFFHVHDSKVSMKNRIYAVN